MHLTTLLTALSIGTVWALPKVAELQAKEVGLLADVEACGCLPCSCTAKGCCSGNCGWWCDQCDIKYKC